MAEATPEIVETLTEACERYGTPQGGPFIITCEHASARVPAPLRTTESDRAWLNSHWGHDIGARTISRELVRLTGSRGVFSRFSRLVCDANRAPEQADFIRTDTEGYPLSFNRAVSPEERARRITTYFEPYHAAVDEEVQRRVLDSAGDVVLLSVHSFTPVWNHRVRPMDVGVLYADHAPVAERLVTELRREGLETASNKPYSGMEGLIYAAARHGQRHRIVYLELEINQSLCCTPARAIKIARRVAAAVGRLRIRSHARLRA